MPISISSLAVSPGYNPGMRGAVLIFAAMCLRAQAPDPQSPPPYFDEPDFIVAGVSDPSERGGHGSDPVFRSADSLAKATAGLRTGKTGDAQPLEAVRQYQRAAEADPSEANLFNWGGELLVHRADDQAAEVFAKAHRRFPRSTRALLGLAAALYARGSEDQAQRAFFEATDLDPRDPAPYLFLGKISGGAIADSDGYALRMARFAHLQPENAWANYYYAATLWRTWKGAGDTATIANVQALLEKAVALDPHLAAASLELGIVFAEQSNLPRAIAAYRAAIAANPALEEAHYRLAQAYRKNGRIEESQKEIERYRELAKESAAAAERERSRMQQFVFEMKR